jgi:arylsulfatase
MEVYAAMVEYMDMSIGRLFEYLRANALYDDTLILFFSDNGANGAPATAYPGNADGSYLATFDNGLENRGLPSSFVDTGPGWAQASSAPFRLFKSFTTQGGIRSPMIARLPGEMATSGGWSHAFLHVADVLLTFLELAGAAYPEARNDRPLAQPIGRSMLQILRGARDSIRDGEGVGYELFEMKAYIRGRWKLLRLPEPFGSGTWTLHDLEEDPGEIDDVSDDHPDVEAALIEAWHRYAEENDVFDHAGHFDALYRQAYGAH